MNDTKFNNLLKIRINIEGDSGDQEGILFQPRMLFYDNTKIPVNINDEGYLLSDMVNMSSGQRQQYWGQQQGQENECVNDLNNSDSDFLKKNLLQNWSIQKDNEIKRFFERRNRYYSSSSSSNNNENRLTEENINKNIKFLTCLFFKKKQTFIKLDDNKIYLIADCKTRDYEINNIEHNASYDRIYNVVIDLTLLDVFKPAYLIFKLNYQDILTKKPQSAIFFPSMNDYVIPDLPKINDKEISVLFSPFIELDQSVFAQIQNKKKVFTSRPEMTSWILESFRKNKKLYSWDEYKRNIFKNNIGFLKKTFFLKDSPLEIEEKEYKVDKVTDTSSSNQSLQINSNNDVILEYSYTLVLKDTTKDEFITLEIKLQIDNSLLTVSGKKKINNQTANKSLMPFTPQLVNKSIPPEDNKVFFIPYFEIPPIYQLQKLNQNIMRLFTVQTEFLKFVHYLREKNKLKKQWDLSNPADKSKIDDIVMKNIQRMMEIFLPPNGEIFLSREIVTNVKNIKSPGKEEKKFFISRSTLVPAQLIPLQQQQSSNKLYTFSKDKNSFNLPFRYSIEVKIELAENKLMLLDFYKLSCKDKTAGLDEKLKSVVLSAYGNSMTPEEKQAYKSEYFTELMKPDILVEPLTRMRPTLASRSGGRNYRTRKNTCYKKKQHETKGKKRNKKTQKKN